MDTVDHDLAPAVKNDDFFAALWASVSGGERETTHPGSTAGADQDGQRRASAGEIFFCGVVEDGDADFQQERTIEDFDGAQSSNRTSLTGFSAAETPDVEPPVPRSESVRPAPEHVLRSAANPALPEFDTIETLTRISGYVVLRHNITFESSASKRAKSWRWMDFRKEAGELWSFHDHLSDAEGNLLLTVPNLTGASIAKGSRTVSLQAFKDGEPAELVFKASSKAEACIWVEGLERARQTSTSAVDVQAPEPVPVEPPTESVRAPEQAPAAPAALAAPTSPTTPATPATPSAHPTARRSNKLVLPCLLVACSARLHRVWNSNSASASRFAECAVLGVVVAALMVRMLSGGRKQAECPSVSTQHGPADSGLPILS